MVLKVVLGILLAQERVYWRDFPDSHPRFLDCLLAESAKNRGRGVIFQGWEQMMMAGVHPHTKVDDFGSFREKKRNCVEVHTSFFGCKYKIFFTSHTMYRDYWYLNKLKYTGKWWWWNLKCLLSNPVLLQTFSSHLPNPRAITGLRISKMSQEGEPVLLLQNIHRVRPECYTPSLCLGLGFWDDSFGVVNNGISLPPGFL